MGKGGDSAQPNKLRKSYSPSPGIDHQQQFNGSTGSFNSGGSSSIGTNDLVNMGTQVIYYSSSIDYGP